MAKWWEEVFDGPNHENAVESLDSAGIAADKIASFFDGDFFELLKKLIGITPDQFFDGVNIQHDKIVVGRFTDRHQI